ncbi:MAG TPA: hypothetical protein VFY73_23605 [Ideonella sp.]|uniref:hypothetical protein n=1 Tax=Ideonella sp. TaxID=1929293 RepID=UPI002E32391A|nr:hypothetical protein [Ideonella sp.]HEX5687010.1 hypothetical protein [Ideonella sp.]
MPILGRTSGVSLHLYRAAIHTKDPTMWKIIAAFVLFAALAMYMLSKGGDVDISGEKHGIDEPAAASQAASAASH